MQEIYKFLVLLINKTWDKNMRPLKNEIVDLTREEIAEKFDVCLRTAVRWQKYYDLYQPKINRLNQKQADLIRKFYAKGKSAKECQAKFGYSLTTIYRILNNEIKQTAQVSVSYYPDN